jgi:hypothetical protein
MKIRAFAIHKETGKYITDQDGNLLQVHAEDAAVLRERYPHVHSQREYRNTRFNPKLRQRLKLVTKNNKSFYSYIGDYERTGGEHIDESESHQSVIIALSRLNKMKFYDPNSDLQLDEFTFTEVLIGPKLELANGKIYFPDLLCRFNEEHPLYDRWGGKLAIEVTYSHPCETKKIHDFMFHNIPIIEVIIDKGSPREYPGERFLWDYYWLSSIEKHTKNLECWFRDFIRVNVLVDPISNRVHEQITSALLENLHNIKDENESISEKISLMARERLRILKDLDDLVLNNKHIANLHVEERNEFLNKIDKLINDKLLSEEGYNKIGKLLNKKEKENSNLMFFIIVLLIFLVGALLSSFIFRESTIKFLIWYFNFLS